MKLRSNTSAALAQAGLALPAAAQSIEAGPLVNPGTGNSYYRLTQSSWIAAEAFARTLGGHLATIEDAAENEWVRANLVNPGGGRGWLGLNRDGGAPNFAWASGSGAPFRQWEPGEPNNAGGFEFYVEMYGNSGNWNDAPNFGTFEQKGIVEVGPAFEITWSTIDGGGGPAAGGTFSIHSSIGQHDAGSVNGGTFTLDGGFWHGLGIDFCYADCDPGTGYHVLDIFDFLCFQNRFDAGDPYACDCDTSSGPLTCDIFDFLCFQNAYDAGCP